MPPLTAEQARRLVELASPGMDKMAIRIVLNSGIGMEERLESVLTIWTY